MCSPQQSYRIVSYFAPPPTLVRIPTGPRHSSSISWGAYVGYLAEHLPPVASEAQPADDPHSARVAALMAKMTLRQKISQMLQLDYT